MQYNIIIENGVKKKRWIIKGGKEERRRKNISCKHGKGKIM